jgi:integrase
MINNNVHIIEDGIFVPPLPEVAYTQEGMAFAPAEMVWNLTDGSVKISLDFRKIPATELMKQSLKTVLVWYVENYSLSYVNNLYFHISSLVLFLAVSQGLVSEVNATDILNFKAHIGFMREWYVGTVSGLLKKWHGFGLPGVAADVPFLLNQLTLKGNEKGTATATMDPIRGPFTTVEIEGLQLALNNDYRAKQIGRAEYVLSWLFIAFGQRPKQYAALKVCDVKRERLKNGSFQYVICIPRAKQRGSGVRGELKERILSAELGKLTYDYAQIVLKKFAKKLENPEQAPLFPALTDHGVLGLEFHQLAKELTQSLVDSLGRLAVVSERTGEPLHVNPRRFRQTIGTRAAEEGHGALIIAELLDHSDTQNVQVYIGSTTAMSERIDRAMAMHLGPLAQAFAGKLIDDGSQASRVFDPLNVIRAPEITSSFEAISSCGKNGFCGFAKPISCYTCNSFEPWLDGPHEEVLAYLLKERERLIAADTRIAQINDRTIFAVAEVIQLCEAIRNEGAM